MNFSGTTFVCFTGTTQHTLVHAHVPSCRVYIPYFYGAYIIYFVAGIHGFVAAFPLFMLWPVQCIMTVPQRYIYLQLHFHLSHSTFSWTFLFYDSAWKYENCHIRTHSHTNGIQCMCPLHAYMRCLSLPWLVHVFPLSHCCPRSERSRSRIPLYEHSTLLMLSHIGK